MFITLSKILPLFVYPLGLTCILLLVALLLRRRRSWQNRCIVFALLLLWIGGNRLVAMTITSSVEWQYLPPEPLPKADVIVVLGGAMNSKDPPRVLPEMSESGDRILYAAWLYREGVSPHLLLSGGQSFASSSSEPEAVDMAFWFQALGVPEEALWLEPHSVNTEENASEARKILAPKGINRIILVTSALHMPRAVLIFQAQGFTVIPAPTDYRITYADWQHYLQPDLAIQTLNLLPNASDLELTSKALKEYLGILVYRFWVSRTVRQ